MLQREGSRVQQLHRRQRREVRRGRRDAPAQELAAEAERSGPRDMEAIQIPPGPRLGSVVIEADKLAKGFGDRKLIEDLSFSLPRAGIVGTIGPNGAGKTTLFRMLTGQEEPDTGEITVGPSVDVAYVDQSRDELDPDRTVFQEITDNVEAIKVGNREVPARAYVSSFNFRGSDHQKLVGTLSGGERQRLKLATHMGEEGGVLVLDEPTTGLHLADVEQLLALLDRLVDAGRSVIVIEHHQAVMAHADWIIDLGPGAGHAGGEIVFEGSPKDLVTAKKKTLTGEHLAAYIDA